MKVLNIEDDAFKHNDICKVLTSCGVNTVYWEKNYEDGWKAIKNAEDASRICIIQGKQVAGKKHQES